MPKAKQTAAEQPFPVWNKPRKQRGAKHFIRLSTGKRVECAAPSTLFIERKRAEAFSRGEDPDEWENAFAEKVEAFYQKRKEELAPRYLRNFNRRKAKLRYLESIGWDPDKEMLLFKQRLESEIGRDELEELLEKQREIVRKSRETAKRKQEREKQAREAKSAQQENLQHVATDLDAQTDPAKWDMREVVLWVMQNMERCTVRGPGGEFLGVDFSNKSRAAPASICLRMVVDYAEDPKGFYRDLVAKWLPPQKEQSAGSASTPEEDSVTTSPVMSLIERLNYAETDTANPREDAEDRNK